MTEEPATRAPHAPQATQTPAPARGEGPGPDKPPQGHTALRERIAEALRTVGLARNLSAYRDAVLPVVKEALAKKDAEIRRLGEAVDADGGRIHRLRVDLAEQAQTLRAVEIDRDQWRDRAHALRAALDADQPKETP